MVLSIYSKSTRRYRMAKIVNVATMPETIATSSRALAVGSGDFEQLKRSLIDVYENRAKLRKQLTKVKFNYFITYIFSSSEKRQYKKKLINKLAEFLENAYINLNFRKGMKDADIEKIVTVVRSVL